MGWIFPYGTFPFVFDDDAILFPNRRERCDLREIKGASCLGKTNGMIHFKWLPIA
ncbi:hypothetical protein [Victivallis sp.]|uniref:hypothetical protein n=1 Tax=Victivallis sp. TaxID=2049020 RepID=UPI003A955958